ncbi:rCG58704 [Rattus norvegicus]|uniref:RCG58704 n=1 Tax=Rattus norvegicus TaxID=10116 RepID=A6JLH5_RAT|nr:rCG58704 [Rattus norvegicus]
MVMDQSATEYPRGGMSASFRLTSGQVFHPVPSARPPQPSMQMLCHYYHRTRRKMDGDRVVRAWGHNLPTTSSSG